MKRRDAKARACHEQPALLLRQATARMGDTNVARLRKLSGLDRAGELSELADHVRTTARRRRRGSR
jgi:hypothetical protein